MTAHPDNSEPQDWRAFEYLSGELSPDDIESFERALANDQPTREALARQVELTGAVRAAFEIETAASERAAKVERPTAPRGGWRQWALWTCLTAAACVAVAVFVHGLGSGAGDSSVVADNAVADNAVADNAPPTEAKQVDLALAWSQSRSDLLEGDELAYGTAELDGTEPDGTATLDDKSIGDSLREEPAAETESVAQPASWMLAAAAARRDASGPNMQLEPNSGDVHN